MYLQPRSHGIWFATALCGLTVACSPSPTTPSACTPGQTSACACISGQMGAQTCQASGSYGACMCAADGVDMATAMDLATAPDLSAARPYRYIFATKLSYLGNLKAAGGGATGLQGADNLCRLAAQAALLPGTYKAWLSDSTATALDRMADGAPWYLVQAAGDPMGPYPVGPRVFNNKATLQIGPLVAINRDEYGTSTGFSTAKTGTLATGAAYMSHCKDWTSSLSSDNGMEGQTASTTAGWTASVSALCNSAARVYCLEQ